MRLDDYPHLRELCVDMCACNGGINRGRSVEAFIADAAPVFKRWYGNSSVDLAATEVWLATLTDDERLTIADGEHEESQELLRSAPGGEYLDSFLNDIFDEAV